MQNLSEKLKLLKGKINANRAIKIAILGLGSVGNYLLNYLNEWEFDNIEIYIGCRNIEKAQKDINISKVSALIRNDKTKKILIKELNLDDIKTLIDFINSVNPDFIVNSSRVYSNLKYGSISWKNIRAYGLWAPLAMKYIKNIMIACKKTNSNAIVINTSYSDAVIPWLKSAIQYYPDFGSGNLNHLIPRIKMALGSILNIEDFSNTDVILAISHFHDVVISKEGHVEGIEPLIKILYNAKVLQIDTKELWKKCAILMPVDAKRNMMNASSNFEIIKKVINALKYETNQILHIPGAFGNVGGYPVEIDGKNVCAGLFEKYFTKEEMTLVNRKSIYLDGIEKIENGSLFYTEELISKVQNAFRVKIPKEVKYEDIEEMSNYIIKKIIEPDIESAKK